LQTADSNKNSTKEAVWLQFKNLSIHSALFKKGIVAIVPNDTLDEYSTSAEFGKSSFFIKDRKFCIVNLKNNKYSKEDCHNSSDKPSMPTGRFIKRAQSIMDVLDNFTKDKVIQLSSPKDSISVLTPNHREEIFLPFIIKEGQEQFGSYVYPWLSDNKSSFKFNGFRQFVTAGCLLGARIQGLDQHNAEFGLIKHDIQFFPGQKITRIKYNSKLKSPYEEVLFLELEKQLRLIKSLSSSDQANLLYHLPYYDYILYGVELFLKGRITITALDRFFGIILSKKEEHIKRITELCAQHNVSVKIESPFENLFGVLPTNDNMACAILGLLNVDLNETDNEIKEEQDLVKNCLEKLQSNDINIEHKKVWQDFLKITSSMEINNLEQLFKIANALMIGIAVRNKDGNETCSFLPISEKQIQVGYAFYSKRLSTIDSEEKNPYPSIINLTFLEPILAYSPASHGLLFYFGSYLENLQDLILEKRILSYSHQNVGFFANNTYKLPIAQFKLSQVLSEVNDLDQTECLKQNS
jgi:hypothetical protein